MADSYVVMGAFVQPFEVDEDNSVVVAQVRIVDSAEETPENQEQITLLLSVGSALEFGEVLMDAARFLTNKEDDN